MALLPSLVPLPSLPGSLSSLLGEPPDQSLFTKCKRSKLRLLSCPSTPNPSARDINLVAHSFDRSNGSVHRRALGLIPEREMFWEAGTPSNTGTWLLGFWLWL